MAIEELEFKRVLISIKIGAEEFLFAPPKKKPIQQTYASHLATLLFAPPEDNSSMIVSDSQAEQLALVIKDATTLRSFHIHKYQFSKIGLQHLAAGLLYNNSITKLVFSENDLRYEGVRILSNALTAKTNQILTSLTIIDNNLQSQNSTDLSSIFQINSLTDIDLSGNYIDDKVVKFIFKAIANNVNSRLTRLSLASNIISENGARIIAENLGKCKQLQVLDLDNNQLGDIGAQYIAEMLKYYNSLRGLQIRDNHITTKGVQTLVNAVCDKRSRLVLFCFAPHRECHFDSSKNKIGADAAEDLLTLLRTRNIFLDNWNTTTILQDIVGDSKLVNNQPTRVRRYSF